VQNRRVSNMELAFEARPEVYDAWRQLVTAVKSGMDERRYELVTLAAARRLRSSYCSLAHGSILLEKFGEPYAAYPKAVNRWWPGRLVMPSGTPAAPHSWGEVLFSERGTLIAVTVTILLMIAKFQGNK